MNEPIAVIGSACRFAGDSTSPSKLWELLKDPKDVLREIPESRFSVDGFHHPDGSFPGHNNVRHSYFLSQDPATFDAEFFGIKPVEAKALDPQQRLLLEVAYEGLESAGLPIENLRGSNTGVYVGHMCNDYEALLLRDFQSVPTYHGIGTSRSIMANRLSYFFDLRGPSMTIDTACSSSLVAVHLATQALRAGDSKVALACGSNLLLGPENYITESKLNMLSPDGRSRMWDAGANGYARGEGVAVVVLKTLSAALADGDHVECIIRETGINQDGTTKGITMPSASAQTTLIRETYRKAGLDPLKDEDRCQYFEAHGTGTPAGDPIEAEAIGKAFFGEGRSSTGKMPLFVGSIKTVLGHTEGAAGVASLIKASLSLQHGVIPPNLLFETLNPKIAPFYDNLEITTSARAWPELPEHMPRRASVNCFGFGGTNVHVIVESYENGSEKTSTRELLQRTDSTFSPFVFSSSSEKTLLKNLSQVSRFLENPSSIRTTDLAWNLHKRRTVLPYRVIFPASSVEKLKSDIDACLSQTDSEIGTRAILAKSAKPAKILAIFTGQGAQYARMGAALIEGSAVVRDTIRQLEGFLAELPENERPKWSLERELLAEPSLSRLDEAALSQPLCTAIQICLVNLLRLAQVELGSVVGHSSGEIGAAYAAGFLSARDAMYVAYYRGFHCSSITSKGAMLAVGTSYEDAKGLCDLPEFAGRVNVAASNSSSSVTLSGDEDAIAELEDIFEDENKFRRRLKTGGMAYHSHHMLSCSQDYIASLKACNIRPRQSQDCMWYSSVSDTPDAQSSEKLKGVYWADNMVNPVLFSQALTRAVKLEQFDHVIEVGCHPALKGPASQEILDILGSALPYTGTLMRNQCAIAAMSESLGSLWTSHGASCVALDKYEEAMSGPLSFKVLKSLPTHQWDHDTRYWHESRISRNLRLRESKVHPLLGDVTPDSSAHHLSWRNMLRMKDLPWLSGHQLQGQTVFPAAGYVATAVEAARALSGGENLELIDVQDFVIHQAMVFDEEDPGIEVLVSLNEVNSKTPLKTTANFNFSAAVGREPRGLTLMASGYVTVTSGKSNRNKLPQRGPPVPHMIDIDDEKFYSALGKVGYDYSGHFRALSSLTRKLGLATGTVNLAPPLEMEHSLLIHPATLDCALQSIILAFSYPDDGELWSLHVPTTIARVLVNPSLCGSSWTGKSTISFDSASTSRDSTGFVGDVSLYDTESPNAAVQVEGMKAVPFAPATAADDKKFFSQMVWKTDTPDGDSVAWDDEVTDKESQLAYVLERIATFYTRKFEQLLSQDVGPFAHYQKWVQHINDLQKTGKHMYANREWLNDTWEDIMAASEPFVDTPDVRMLHVIGEQVPLVARGRSNILEHIRTDGLLDEYYVSALGYPQFSKWLARTITQIAHRYPKMDILEVGAGTGGATKSILGQLGSDFGSYTFTDVSTGFFESAQSTFADYGNRIIFSALNAEHDPVAQGYTPHSYDLVVASFVIHATSRLDEALKNVRRLLKPGGFLVLAEGTNNDVTRNGFTFGTLPGWWAGVDEGRLLSPCVSPEEWDAVLRTTGFSGIDTITPDHLSFIYGGSVFVSQAIDDQVNFLRDPLSATTTSVLGQIVVQNVVIIGGKTLKSARLVANIKKTLERFSQSVAVFKTLDDVKHAIISAQSLVISLTEIDLPVFKSITETQFESLKSLFGPEKTILWVTTGRRADDPFSNMTIGFGRSAILEVPELRLQYLDFGRSNNIDSNKIVESALRFQFLENAKKRGDTNDLLWAIEPEVTFDKNGTQLVPRLEQMQEANDRYNTDRRSIRREVKLEESAILVSQGSEHHFAVTARSLNLNAEASQSSSLLRSTYTHATPIATHSGLGYLALGKRQNGEKVLAVNTELVSSKPLSEDAVYPLGEVSISDTSLLRLAWATILAKSIIAESDPGDGLILHEPTQVLARIVKREAHRKDVQVIFTTYLEFPPTDHGWIRLSALMTRYQIQRLLPKNATLFYDLGFTQHKDVERHTLVSCLPKHCRVRSIHSAHTWSHSDPATFASLKDIVERAIDHENVLEGLQDPETISIGDISAGFQPQTPDAILSWNETASVHIPMTRLEDQGSLFQSGKTYWLVGLSGDLGLSLCDWMIDHGAKHVVITSRNPGKVNSAWVEAHRQGGAQVELIANDVTKADELRAVYETINATMPPIAGLVQGSMVLLDVSIHNMTFEQMTTVLKPRVQGTLNLDNLFIDKDLDFFVLLSSMTGVLGNIGQANYTTSNAFLSSMAANRRNRGLAASVANVGAVVGAGYVTREVRDIDDSSLARVGMMWVSERDFHQTVAESIEAGRLDSKSEPEISTGLREVAANSLKLPPWFNDPKFARFAKKVSNKDDQSIGVKGIVSIKDRLQAAQTMQDVLDLITESFSAKLRVLLQIKTEDAALMKMRSDEIGLDSLIAVEVRSWFLKNYEANIPVLSILSGMRLHDLAKQALKDVPHELIPNVDNISGAQTVTEAVEPLDGSPANDTDEISDSSSKSVISSEETSLTESSTEVIQEHDALTKLLLERTTSLSFTQSMFWFVHALMQDKTTLNHTVLFRIAGKLRVDDLRRAVKTVGQLHEATRTCFFVDESQAVLQGVLEKSTLDLEMGHIEKESDIEQHFENFRTHVFDLHSGQMIRVRLLTCSSDVNYLLVVGHHLVLDGMSHLVFMSDLEKAYDGLALDQNVLQYSDYSIKQKAEYDSGEFESDLHFWRDELSNIPDPLPLNRARRVARQPANEYNNAVVHFRVRVDLANKIRRISKANRSTSFHFYLAAFEVLIHRLTTAREFCIGIADGNRKEEAMLASFGPYVNLLPLRFAIKPQTFSQAISEARTKAYTALAHSRPPFEILMNELRVPRSSSHSPIFQAFIDYRQGTQEKQKFSDCMMEMTKLETGKTAYDISIDIIDNPSSDALIAVMTQVELYSADDAQTISNMYEDILEEFSASPEKRLTSDWAYRNDNLQEAFSFGRGQPLEMEWSHTLIHRVQEMILKHGDSTAITEANGESFTYREMSQRVHAISSTLLDGGLTPGQRVAVFQEPTANWAFSMLALMQIGGVYVPLESRTRAGRLAAVLDDCQAVAILVDSTTKSDCEFLIGSNVEIIDVSNIRKLPFNYNGAIHASADAPAMVLYTSGSTGIPKGVVLTHSNFVSEVETSKHVYGLDSGIVALQQSAITFDMSVLQVFLGLALGGKLVIIPKDMRGDSVAIADVLVKEKVTYTCATPSEYNSWLRFGDQSALRTSSWSVALSGGEPFAHTLLASFKSLNKCDLRVFNGYGPTETTCCSTKLEISFEEGAYPDAVPAGLPSPNEAIYILDENLRLLPTGLPGQIAIAGAGVASGYVSDDMTKTVFVSNPYAQEAEHQRGFSMMYLTGDRGRLLNDGNLYVEGRLGEDTQVKICGMRIDLKDVEQTILKTAKGSISEAVLSVRSTDKEGSESLVGHVVFLPGQTPVNQDVYLRGLLADLPLPQYMCPAVLVPLDEVPKTTSGKLDRRAIAELKVEMKTCLDSLLIPLSEVELELKNIWEQVLSHGASTTWELNAEADFFQIGGTSLLLIEVQAQICTQFDLQVKLVDLFNSSTLGAMAQLIEQKTSPTSGLLIDWDAETALPDDLFDSDLVTQSPASARPRTILLTGASAPLGQHIIRCLLLSSQVDKIICLAVRRLEQRLSAGKLLRDPRIVYHAGDLSTPGFGLSPTDLACIFAEVDAVVHNGAEVSHLKSYVTLRAANFTATQDLVRLCLPRAIPFHYVSTGGIATFDPILDSFGEVSASSMPPPTDSVDGYTASKWASERFLERVNACYGAKVWIHRPSGIVRPEEEQDHSELLLSILSFSRKLRAVPKTDLLRGALDLVAIERASGDIVKDVLGNIPKSRDGLSFVHHTGDTVVPFDDMKGYLERESRGRDHVDELSLSDWAERAQAVGLPHSLVVVIKNVEHLGKVQINIPRFVKNRAA